MQGGVGDEQVDHWKAELNSSVFRRVLNDPSDYATFSFYVVPNEILHVFRYAIKDLWESEKEYVRDLTFVMDNYFKVFEGSVPDELSGKRDLLFSTYPEIFNFHNE